MIALSYTVLAAPLIAAAVAVSYPMRVLSPRLARFQPQGSGVHARQVLVPPECFPVCDPIATTIEECLDAGCACTSGNMNALFSCVECTVAVWQTTGSIASGQATLDNFAKECAASGIPLAMPTVTASTGTAPPTVNGPKATSSPPTGVPLSFGKSTTAPTPPPSGGGGGGSATTAETATPSATGTQGGTGPVSGTMRVGVRAQVIWMVFSLCVVVVSLA